MRNRQIFSAVSVCASVCPLSIEKARNHTQNDVDVEHKFSQKIDSVKWTHHQNDRTFNSCFRTSSKASEHELCVCWEFWIDVKYFSALSSSCCCCCFVVLCRSGKIDCSSSCAQLPQCVHVPIIMAGKPYNLYLVCFINDDEKRHKEVLWQNFKLNWRMNNLYASNSHETYKRINSNSKSNSVKSTAANCTISVALKFSVSWGQLTY